jgi:polyisoprenyl-phosphate glycosyltransferase
MRMVEIDLTQESPSTYDMSIVIPFLNEEGNVRPLYEALETTIGAMDKSYEIIYVDDGSTDRSVELIQEIRQRNPHVKVLSLSRNYGTQVALSAGLRHAQGDVVISMDADLQHPPKHIPEMYAKYLEGFNVVHAVKQRQEKRGLIKNILSKVGYAMIRRMSDIELEPTASDFRLFSRQALQAINAFSERDRFLRGLSHWMGLKHANIYFVAPERHSGEAKQTLRKLIGMGLEGIFSFSLMPLRLFTYAGVVIAIFCAIYAVQAIIGKFLVPGTPLGYADIMVSTLFLGGIQLIFLGIIGEYIGRILVESRQRPLYFIANKIGFAEQSAELQPQPKEQVYGTR